MKKKMIIKNIKRVKSWLKKEPHDEDYLRLLKEFKRMEREYVQKN